MFAIDPAILQKYRDSVDTSNFPKKFMETWYAHAKPEELKQWYTERFLCLKYHLFLSGYAVATKAGDPDLPKSFVPILGMDFQDDPHTQLFKCFVQKRPGEDMVLSDLETQTKKRMILWPRGIFKTSAVIVDIVQSILNYPNVRICFLTGGDSLAKRQLTRIRNIFEKPTPRFKFLFPEFCFRTIRNIKVREFLDKDETVPNPAAWSDVQCKIGTAHELTVPCRTKDIFAEPTFAISTARSVKAGSHFDLIYVDDLVNETNFRKTDALAKCYEDYLAVCPLLDPTGLMVVTGTRYSFGDTYERIQESAREEERLIGHTIWKISIRDCWSMGCLNCPHTDVYHEYDKNILQPPCGVLGCGCPGFKPNGSKGVLFPQTRALDKRPIGHTLEFLEGEKIRLGEEFFANQYENKPIATGAQVFTETLIGGQTLHDLGRIPPYSQSFTFGVGDLAYVGQAGRDYSVIYICRLFQGQIFLFDCLYGNWDSGQLAENTLNALTRHRPNVIYYEKFNGWEVYDKVIAAFAATNHVPKVPIQWEKGSQTPNAKLIRIGAIKGWLTSKRFWIYAGMPGYARLVQQLVKWPKLGRHDDFADCAGMIFAAPTGIQASAPPPMEDANSWLRRLNQSRPATEEDSRPAGSYDPFDEGDGWK